VRISEIARLLEAEVIGDIAIEIQSVAALDTSTSEDLTFFLSAEHRAQLQHIKARAIVTYEVIPGLDIPQIIVKNPKKALAQVISLFNPGFSSFECQPRQGVSPHAVLHASVSLGKEVTVGPFCVIGENVKIGDGTVLTSHVVIGKNVKIGSHCKLHSFVTLYDNVEMGHNVVLHAGTVVGSDGFGYYLAGEKWETIPQISGVRIGNDVHIGANAAIDRGCLSHTVIGKGVKIDNLVQVAHNAQVGDHCLLVSQVGIVGSAKLDHHVVVGGQSGVGAVHLGAGTQVAGRSGVTKSTAPNAVVSGFPAQDHRLELKKEAFIRKLVNKSLPKT